MSLIFKNFTYLLLRIVIFPALMTGCTIFFSMSCQCHAEVLQNNDNVISYKSESDMIKGLLKSMEKHKSAVSVSYPHICRDFSAYKKNNYRDFFDRLSIKNGYSVGILSGYCVSVNSDMEYVTFQFNYMTTKRQERYIDRKAKKIVRRFKGKKIDKIRQAHDYLVRHMRYDARYHNPYYAFRKGKGLCMSYALSFQRLMNEMSIPCIYIKGNNHAWNMVKIGSVWYNIDVTWDDSCGSYKYFLKCDRDFPRHRANNSKYIRKLKKATHSYFYRK